MRISDWSSDVFSSDLMTAKVNIDRLDVALSGRGQSRVWQAQVGLAPSAAFPLRNATGGLELADGSFLHGKFDWVATLLNGMAHDRVKGSIEMHKLNVGALIGPAIPAAVVTASMDVDARLLDHHALRAADLKQIGRAACGERVCPYV